MFKDLYNVYIIYMYIYLIHKHIYIYILRVRHIYNHIETS